MSRQHMEDPASNGVTRCERCQHTTRHIRESSALDPRFLRCTYSPSETERKELENMLKEAKRDFEWLEEEVKGLRRRLLQLKKAKAVAEITSKQCRSALSAHRRIPVEVWKMIFSELCLSLHEYSFDIEPESPTSRLLGLPPVVISQVCSHWKDIVNDSPRLWSSINVNITKLAYGIITPLKLYLARSQGHLLRLRITTMHNIVPSVDLIVWETLSIHIHRSKTFILDVQNYNDVRSIPGFHLTFPDLEFYSEESLSPDPRTWPWFWAAIQGAPKLVTVSSACLPPGVPIPQLKTWEVQTLATYHDFVGFFYSLKCRGQSLTTLTLTDIWNMSSDYFVDTEDVNLLSLRHFDVLAYEDASNWLSCILGSLNMPSLETCNIKYGRWSLPSTLFTMINCSSPSLTRLVLDVKLDLETPIVRDIVLIDVLQAAPRLIHFELSLNRARNQDGEGLVYGSLFDSVVSELLLKFEDDFRPFLSQLAFLNLALPDITLNTQIVQRVLDIVSARQGTFQPLKEFGLVSCGISSGVESDSGGRFIIGHEMLERVRILGERGSKIIVEQRIEGL